MRSGFKSIFVEAFRPLSEKPFRNLWVSDFISNIGLGAQILGTTWILIDSNAGPAMIAGVHVAFTMPVLFLALLGGALSDIYGYRLIQLFAQLLMLLSSSMLISMYVLDFVSIWLALGTSFIAGIGVALRTPAWLASFKALVQPRDLAAAVTLSSLGVNLARALGPALGGLLTVLYSPIATAVLHLVSSFVFAWMILLFGQRRKIFSSSRTSLSSGIVDGILYATNTVVIRNTLIRSAFIGVTSGAILSLLPVLSSMRFEGDASLLGLLLWLFGTGAIFAAITLPKLRNLFDIETILLWGTVLCGFSLLSLSVTPSWGVSVPILIIGGVGWIAMFSTLSSCLQIVARSVMRARTLAIYMTLGVGGSAVGGLLWGSLAQYTDLTIALAVPGGLLIATNILKYFFPINERLETV